MAKYTREYENGIAKHTLTFRNKTFDFSMIPTESSTKSDKSCFSSQLEKAFPDLDEETLTNDIDVDMLDCSLDEDEVFEILDQLNELE